MDQCNVKYLKFMVRPTGDFNYHIENLFALTGVERDVVPGGNSPTIFFDEKPMVKGTWMSSPPYGVCCHGTVRLAELDQTRCHEQSTDQKALAKRF